MTARFRPLDPKRQRQAGFGAALVVSLAAHAILVGGIWFSGSASSLVSGFSSLGEGDAPREGTVRFLTLTPLALETRPADRGTLALSVAPSIAGIEIVGSAQERKLPGALGAMSGSLPIASVGTGGRVGSVGIGSTGAGGAGDQGGGSELLAPRPRYTVLPPLDRPASVRGKSFKVRFWVNQFGNVTRVEVSPEIPDAEYREKFLALMYQYSFEPARRPDGTPVAGQAVLTVTL